MTDTDRFKLLHGPYRTPRFRYGSKVLCEVRGEVTICDLTEARIPWPVAKRGRARSLVVYGGLANAVRRESAIAVSFWWGVTSQTVTKWRKALGVPVTNEGTHRLRSDYWPEVCTPEVLEKAVAAMNTPVANAKKAATRQGKPLHPNARRALDRARRRPRSLEHRRKFGEASRRLGLRPRPDVPLWTAEEDALLGVLPDDEVAQKTGRTIRAVRCRRHVLRIPARGGRGPKMKRPKHRRTSTAAR